MRWGPFGVKAEYILKGVFAKNDRGISLMRKKVLLIATNLTSIWCVYTVKIVKNDLPKNVVSTQIQKDQTFNSDRKKSIYIQTNHSDIANIDYFSTHLYIIDISFFMIRMFFFKTLIPVSRIFNNEDEIFIYSRNVRKFSASNKNYFLKKQIDYEILTLYKCVEK